MRGNAESKVYDLLWKHYGRSAALPNIVYILADDLGYGDVPCLNPGRGKLPAPNIDRLAAEGMTFTDAHSGSAVCTATRYGILTGRYRSPPLTRRWRLRQPGRESGLGLYGDWVMQTGAAVGEVLRAPDRQRQRDRTLVIFTSDNGCAPYAGIDYDVEQP